MSVVEPPPFNPFLQALERADVEHTLQRRLEDFDQIIVTFSGGKDSLATLLHLLMLGAPLRKVELWHHEIDEPEVPFMDWPCTPGYCRAVAAALNLPIYFSGRQGGFLRELNRREEPQAPIFFDVPGGGRRLVGGKGPARTRGRFPALAADLRFRWCSAQLKIEVGRAIFRHDPRFKEGNFLYLSGERAEESRSRARYKAVEADVVSTRRRRVVRWRPMHTWSEEAVWNTIAQWRIRPHPGYRLGFSRLSCLTCIFGDPNQWATVREMAPAFFDRVASREAQAPMTIRAKKRQRKGIKFYEQLPLATVADRGCSFLPRTREVKKLVRLAMSTEYTESVVLDEKEVWELPLGAFKRQGGPT